MRAGGAGAAGEGHGHVHHPAAGGEVADTEQLTPAFVPTHVVTLNPAAGTAAKFTRWPGTGCFP